jgi:hypothetical protein
MGTWGMGKRNEMCKVNALKLFELILNFASEFDENR